MHPYGGSPVCPRCSKAVYAAEQTMGPGRKLYHKPCLACTICNKRLDSYTLLEHDEEPYCKSCHSKNFGTRDLRSANLPHRDNSLPGTPDGSPFSPSKTPARFTASPPPRVASPVRSLTTGTAPGAPRLRANRSLATTPTSPSFPRTASPSGFDSDPEERDTVDGNDSDLRSQGYAGVLSNTGRPGRGGIPRTVPLSPTRKGTYGKSGDREYGDSVASSDTEEQESAQAPREQSEYTPVVLGSSNIGASMMSSYSPKPLMQTATGTRYGAALNGGSGGVKTNVTGSPRKWGAVTPSCAGCGKSVYFAEQVKAVGKTWHKNCLRCSECKTSLDSNKLRDHDGTPLCVRCYSKLHGPAGSGYALLGKAGG